MADLDQWAFLKLKIENYFSLNLSKSVVNELIFLLDYLQKLIINNNINLPAPQLDLNREATLDIIWFNRQKQTALGLTVLPASSMAGRIWMHMLQINIATDWYDPSDEEIIQQLKNLL